LFLGAINFFFALVKCGFHNWKDGTIAFQNHEKYASHKEAVEVMITLPSVTKDIGEHLSHKNSNKLYTKLSLHRDICAGRVCQSEEMEINQMTILINCCT